MQIVISSGHGKYVRGASGYLDEVDEARHVVEQVATLLEHAGVGVKTFHDNTSTSQDQNLRTIVNYHNSQTRDLDVSVHFNAYETTKKPMGTECLYVTQQTLADKVATAIARAGSLIDRGPKKRTDLYFLNNTEEPAILIETCFVDSQADADLYYEHFDSICTAIAETIGGVEIGDQPPDIEEPPEELPPSSGGFRQGVVHNLVGADRLNIRASASSNAPVIGQAKNDDVVTVVGESWSGSTKWLKLQFGMGVVVYGWASSVYIEVEGGEVPSSEWHEQITATVFGHEGDEQEGSYGGWIDSDTVGVSFPYKWRDSPRPSILVAGPLGEMVVDVVDVGPWNTDDPDYVLGTSRPLSEKQYQEGTEAQNGQVPTNDAGIDLTKPVADRIGISGKGKVRWRIA
jgi:N-acetylmuramoyl-L-alanine amidase